MAVLRFSMFELDQSSGELTRQGRRVHIAPQSFKVLWLLASRAGSVVTRDELRQLLWADGTHVDFDRSLNFCIAAVRRALGDAARNPRFIETLPQRGYRFMAEVHHGEQPSRDVRTDPGAPRRSATTTLRQWWWAAAIPLLLAQQPTTMSVHSRTTAEHGALAAFDRGLALWDEGVDGRRRSADAFATAVRLDGRFAEAHYALAATYLDLAQARALPPREAVGLAKSAVERAVDLEDVAASRRLLARVRLVHDWDWAGARRDLIRAIALAPDDATSLAAYAEFLSASGDDAGALAAIDRAERLGPACVLFASASLHYRARRYDRALSKLDEVRRSSQPFDLSEQEWAKQVHTLALLIHRQQEDWPAAQVEAAALVRLSGVSRDRVNRFLALPPRQALARFFDRSVEELRPDAVRGEASITEMARRLALAGAANEAIAWLERGLDERAADLVYALRDPAFDSLRHQPRFAALEAAIFHQQS